mgnify:CR=1 FL=1
MRKILHHSFSAVLLLGFVLYTIPVCTCAEMMKMSESKCCSAKSDSKPLECCQTQAAAEKMNPEKAFEASKPSVEIQATVSTLCFALNLEVSLLSSVYESATVLSPPTLARLQVFRI